VVELLEGLEVDDWPKLVDDLLEQHHPFVGASTPLLLDEPHVLEGDLVAQRLQNVRDLDLGPLDDLQRRVLRQQSNQVDHVLDSLFIVD